MKRTLFVIGVIASMATSCTIGAFAAEWQRLFEDRFDRPAMGPDWRMLRGDWRIEDGGLRVTRQWPSDSAVLCARPMLAEDQRAEFEVRLGEKDALTACLRSGEILWGGGGINDQFGLSFRAGAPPEKDDGRFQYVAPDAVHSVAIEISGGRGTAWLDGRKVLEQEVGPARSEVNVHFGMTAIPNAWVGNVRLFVRGREAVRAPAGAAEENARATQYAKDYIDPENPALGIQKAIDALPPGGGAVILPAGRFVLRRHLHLRSNMTLRGEGPDRTILVAPLPFGAKITERKTGDPRVVSVDDASRFQVGDAVSLGPAWSHPGTVGTAEEGNRGVTIEAIQGHALTLSEAVPPEAKDIFHFFPAIYARMAEFVEARDLRIEGDPAKDVPVGGRFMTNPVTFGVVYGARIHNVVIDGWKADGISVQGGADCLVTDNEVSRVHQGFHPGTTTERFLMARNVARDNGLGLFFCWYNRNGVYFLNALDGIGGYADAGDVFNTLAFNRVARPLEITTGYGGVLFGNVIPSISFRKGKREAGLHAYQQAGRHFLLAANVCESIAIGENATGNIIAGNITTANAPTLVKGQDDGNVLTDAGIEPPGPPPLSERAERAPVALPKPVLDGRAFHQPGAPDAGFQEGLDALAAQGGGTFLLPGGRYALRQGLHLRANVTLAGQGSGTVLALAPDAPPQALIFGKDVDNAAVRDLTLTGPGNSRDARGAIHLEGGRNLHVLSVDVRNWRGDGMVLLKVAGAAVRDCRILKAAGEGISLEECADARVETTIVGECEDGVRAEHVRGALLQAVISSRNRRAGFTVQGGRGLELRACNASFNLGAGLRLASADEAKVAANTFMSNGRDGRPESAAGIVLEAGCRGARVLYNNCGDEQIHPTQAAGIREDATCSGSVIRGNVTCPLYGPDDATPTLIAEGRNGVVADNITRALHPTGSSLEWLRLKAERGK